MHIDSILFFLDKQRKRYYIKYEGSFILSEPIDIKFDDPDDKAFYEVAITGKANYLVTGNKKHFPEDKLIVTPAEFFKKLNK